MSTFLSQVRGFTPVIDVVVEDVGLTTATVYGRIWRYCQMKDGVCQASMETIAKSLNVSTRTARRHAKKLVNAGYLKDLTPNLRNKPHTYADTGKVVIQGLLEAKTGMTKSHTGMTKSHTEVRQKVTPGYDRESNEDSSLRESLRDSQTEERTKTTTTPSQEMFGGLAKLCKLELETLTKKSRGKLNSVTKRLLEINKTPAMLDLFEEFWYAAHWKGEKGQPPDPYDVLNEWGRARDWLENGSQKKKQGLDYSGIQFGGHDE